MTDTVSAILDSATPAVEETAAVEEQSAEQITTEQAATEESSNNDLSRQFSALSKREKAFREERDAFRTEMESLKQLREELNAQKEPIKEEEPSLTNEQILHNLKRDPLATLDQLGLSYDKLTELALNDGKHSEEERLGFVKEDIESKFQKQLEELKAQLEEKDLAAQTAEEEAAVKNFKSSISDTVTQNADKYEAIIANDAQDLIFDVINKQYENTKDSQTPVILEVEEAAEMVENYLLKEARKLTSLKKLNADQEETQTASKPNNTQSSNTLTNALSAQASKETDRKLTLEESKARAAAMIKWT